MTEPIRNLLAKAIDDLDAGKEVDLIELERQCEAAAIARHLAPGDDLVERATGIAHAQDEYGKKNLSHFSTGPLIRDLLARIAALTATVAELQAEVGKVTSDRAYIIGANDGWDEAVAQGEASPAVRNAMVRFWQKMAERHQNETATLRASLALLEGALRQLKDNAKGPWVPSSVVGAIVDAALTDGGSNG